MGNSSSQQEGESSSSQQTQPPQNPPYPPPNTLTLTPPQTTTTNNHNNIIKPNHENTPHFQISHPRTQTKNNLPCKVEPNKIIPQSGNIMHTSTNTKSNIRREKKEVIKLPHNCEAILRDSDSPIDKSSLEKLYQQLYSGVYLNGGKKKYWVEEKGKINCFMVFANGLSITWSEDRSYWQWHTVEIPREGRLTIAELKNVCWLEVKGRFHTSNLSPEVTYEVAFIIKLEYSSYGWEAPVNIRLTLPNGTKQEHKEHLKNKPCGEWIKIPVGEFRVCNQENLGEIEFYLYEYEDGHWKNGLVVKGVTIGPK